MWNVSSCFKNCFLLSKNKENRENMKNTFGRVFLFKKKIQETHVSEKNNSQPMVSQLCFYAFCLHKLWNTLFDWFNHVNKYIIIEKRETKEFKTEPWKEYGTKLVTWSWYLPFRNPLIQVSGCPPRTPTNPERTQTANNWSSTYEGDMGNNLMYSKEKAKPDRLLHCLLKLQQHHYLRMTAWNINELRTYESCLTPKNGSIPLDHENSLRQFRAQASSLPKILRGKMLLSLLDSFLFWQFVNITHCSICKKLSSNKSELPLSLHLILLCIQTFRDHGHSF